MVKTKIPTLRREAKRGLFADLFKCLSLELFF
jgi:hypothetical protein